MAKSPLHLVWGVLWFGNTEPTGESNVEVRRMRSEKDAKGMYDTGDSNANIL